MERGESGSAAPGSAVVSSHRSAGLEFCGLNVMARAGFLARIITRMTWLLESHNTIFTIAFVVMLGFAALETVSLLCGLGISEWLQNLLPGDGGGGADADFSSGGHGADGHAETSSDLDGGGPGALQSVLSWLEIGKLPLLVTLNLFFAAFSVSGLILQGVVTEMTDGAPLPPLPAGLIAFAAAVPLLKLGNRVLGSLWPRDETSAVRRGDFVGCHGVITLGAATRERASEVKFTGPAGDTHYVLAFAAHEDLPPGAAVVLVARHPELHAHFLAIRNPDPGAPAGSL